MEEWGCKSSRRAGKEQIEECVISGNELQQMKETERDRGSETQPGFLLISKDDRKYLHFQRGPLKMQRRQSYLRCPVVSLSSSIVCVFSHFPCLSCRLPTHTDGAEMRCVAYCGTAGDIWCVPLKPRSLTFQRPSWLPYQTLPTQTNSEINPSLQSETGLAVYQHRVKVYVHGNHDIMSQIRHGNSRLT